MGRQKWSTVPADRGGDPPAVLDTGLNHPQPLNEELFGSSSQNGDECHHLVSRALMLVHL